METPRQILNNFPFRLLAATKAVADARTPVFERSNYEVCTFEYIVKGAGSLVINDRTFQPQTDDIYILAKGSTHAYWPNRDNPWHKYFFVVDGELMTALIRAYAMDNVYHIRKCRALRHYFEQMIALNPNSDTVNQQSSLIFHSLVDELSQLVHGVPSLYSPEIQKLKDNLDSALNSGFNLSEYAAGTNYSEAHLIRIFRDAFNMTPYDYLMSKKIDLAKRLLLYSSFSIKEIAAHLAFSDQYYFSNYFKMKCGLSPRNYKNKFVGIRKK